MPEAKDDRGYMQNKGFARVYFATNEEVENAIATKNETVLKNRRLLIKNGADYRKPKKTSPFENPKKRPKTDATEQESTCTSAETTEKNTQSAANSVKISAQGSATLFVGNLAFSCTQQLLQETFEKFGSIHNVRMATFEDSGKCKGFAYIDFADEASARSVFATRIKPILGRQLRIEFATTATSRPARRPAQPHAKRRAPASQ